MDENLAAACHMNYEFSNLLKWDSEMAIRQITFIVLTVKERILEKLLQEWNMKQETSPASFYTQTNQES